MGNTIRIKRRAVGGAAGAPSTLQNAELAYNEQDDTLYYGKGTGGAGGSASQVIPIAGPGSFATINTNQTITGVKTFDQAPLVPTATFGTNTLAAASTAFVQAAVSAASIPDGDKGDITVSGNGSSWAIDANTVNNTKLAPMAANTLKGRSGSTGGPDDLTAAQVKTMLAINNVDNTSDVNKPISTATQSALDGKISTSQLAVANGVATLGADGKLNANQVNALAISDTYVVANQAAMLAIADADVGDIAVRSDQSKSYILKATPASVLSNWQELLTPNSPVSSVFGRTGSVTAASGDYTVAQVTGAAPIASPAFTGTPTVPTASAGTNTTQVASTAFVTAGLALKANLASPTFTGSVAAPTPTAGNNSTLVATTAFVQTAVGGRLLTSNNLSDVPNKATARTNLELGSMAVQNANAVTITGGTIDNIDLDGGTF